MGMLTSGAGEASPSATSAASAGACDGVSTASSMYDAGTEELETYDALEPESGTRSA